MISSLLFCFTCLSLVWVVCSQCQSKTKRKQKIKKGGKYDSQMATTNEASSAAADSQIRNKSSRPMPTKGHLSADQPIANCDTIELPPVPSAPICEQPMDLFAPLPRLKNDGVTPIEKADKRMAKEHCCVDCQIEPEMAPNALDTSGKYDRQVNRPVEQQTGLHARQLEALRLEKLYEDETQREEPTTEGTPRKATFNVPAASRGKKDHPKMAGSRGSRDRSKTAGSRGSKDQLKVAGSRGKRDQRQMAGSRGKRDQRQMASSRGNKDHRQMAGIHANNRQAKSPALQSSSGLSKSPVPAGKRSSSRFKLPPAPTPPSTL